MKMKSVDVFSNFLEEGRLEETLALSGASAEAPRVQRASRIAKHALDICGALVGMLLLALLLPIIALLIWWEDRGPILYKQVRVGQNSQPFVIYKFRSMIANADDYLARHPELLEAWSKDGKLKSDPRVTRIGAFLRSTSLDELPQVINILRGEMSLVGPRAIQFSEKALFGELIELRQSVHPGLTGLWQISGRSMTDYEQRCILDSIYVIDWSFWLDIEILLRTLPTVFHRVGAF
jgi:lipopolysaccharide/colanic/teichoic acid biosynthesis glycosyltransferase